MRNCGKKRIQLRGFRSRNESICCGLMRLTCFYHRNQGEKSYCGSWDTGAMICLVARWVVEELNREGLVIASRQVKVKIVGIGEGIVKAGEEVRLKLKLTNGMDIEHTFLVLEEAEQMPYCFLLGIDLMRVYGISLDFGQDRVGINGVYDTGMRIGDSMGLNFAGWVQLDPESTDELGI